MSKRVLLASFTVKNWRRKVLSNDRKRRRRKVFFLVRSLGEGVLLFDFFYFFNIKIILNLIFK